MPNIENIPHSATGYLKDKGKFVDYQIFLYNDKFHKSPMLYNSKYSGEVCASPLDKHVTARLASVQIIFFSLFLA